MFEDDQVFEFSNIGIGDEFYQQMSFISDGWFLGSAADRAESGNFLAFANAIITEASDLSYVGEEDVDGVATYHLQGTLAREVLELVETEGPLPETMAVELWVGKDDSLVRLYVARAG